MGNFITTETEESQRLEAERKSQNLLNERLQRERLEADRRRREQDDLEQQRELKEINDLMMEIHQQEVEAAQHKRDYQWIVSSREQRQSRYILISDSCSALYSTVLFLSEVFPAPVAADISSFLHNSLRRKRGKKGGISSVEPGAYEVDQVKNCIDFDSAGRRDRFMCYHLANTNKWIDCREGGIRILHFKEYVMKAIQRKQWDAEKLIPILLDRSITCTYKHPRGYREVSTYYLSRDLVNIVGETFMDLKNPDPAAHGWCVPCNCWVSKKNGEPWKHRDHKVLTNEWYNLRKKARAREAELKAKEDRKRLKKARKNQKRREKRERKRREKEEAEQLKREQGIPL